MVKLASRWIVAAAAVITSLYIFDSQMLAPVLPIYASRETGAAPLMVGIIMGIYSLSNCAGNIVFGRWSDLRGRRLPLTIGFIGTGLLVLTYSLPASPIYLVFIRLVQGFFAGAMGPCTAAILTDLAPANRRGAYMGIWGMSVAIGVTICSGTAGFLSTNYGYYSVWTTIAAACGLAVVIIWAFIPETRPRKGLFSGADATVTVKPDLSGILKRKNVLFTCYGIFSLYWLLGTIVVLFSLHLAEFRTSGIIRPDPKMAVGILLSVFGLAAVMLNYLFGRLADTIGRKPLLIAAFALLACAPLLITNPSVPFMVVSWIIAWAFAASIIWPALLALLTDELAENERGAGLGLFMLALTLGTGIGMPVMGAAGSILGLTTGIKVAAVLPAVAFVLSLFLKPKPVSGGVFGWRPRIIMVVIIGLLLAAAFPLIRFLQP